MRPSSSHSFEVTATDLSRQRRTRNVCGRRLLGRGRLLAIRADELANAVGLLSAEADPVVDAGQIELQLRLALAGDRVEVPYLLQILAALTLAAVRDDDVIEGLIRSPAPGEADSD